MDIDPLRNSDSIPDDLGVEPHPTDDISFEDLAAFTEAATPSTEAEPPKKRRTGLLVAGFLGGGAVLGGGGIVAIGGVLTALGLGGVAFLVYLNSGSAEAVEAAPVAPVVETTTDEETDAAPGTDEETDEAEAAPSEQPVTRPTRPAGTDSAGATPAPAAPAVVVEKVEVTVRSENPGASVMVDGKFAGKTPIDLNISATTHEIKIYQGRASGSFQVDAGESLGWCFATKGKKVYQTGC